MAPLPFFHLKLCHGLRCLQHPHGRRPATGFSGLQGPPPPHTNLLPSIMVPSPRPKFRHLSVLSNFLVFHTASDLFGTSPASPPSPHPLVFLHSLLTQLRCRDSPPQQPFLNSPAALFSLPGTSSASALASTFPLPLPEKWLGSFTRGEGGEANPGHQVPLTLHTACWPTWCSAYF